MKLIIIPAVLLVCIPAQGALIAWWAQNEASGNVIDATGGHAPAILAATGAVNYAQPGVPNGTYGSVVVTAASGTSIGYGPNASEDYFQSGADNNNPVMNIAPTSSLTVMSWINPQAPDILGRTYRPVSTGSGAGADRGWGFGLRLNDVAGATSAIRFTTYGVADNDSDMFVVTFGNWIHMAATYNNGVINYYLNGNLLGGSDTSLFGADLAAARLTIGARIGTPGNDGDQTNGLLDGIRVYNEVLTIGQIQAAALASVRVIPEPSVLGLALLGAAGLVRRRRVA